MAINKVKISGLPSEEDLRGLHTIGVNAQNESVKVSLEFVLDAAEGADTAAAAANKAKTDADAATKKATDAAASANTAAGKANTAAGKADTATAAANTAKSDADAATKKATDAAASANNAANRVDESITDITAEKSAALEAAKKATEAATQADTSREQIEENEEARKAAESSRATAEQEREAAEAAREKASAEAVKNAQAATQSANDAAGAANQATEEAQTATQAANTAAQNATTKAGEAGTAATNANKAKSDAETATKKANDAAASATSAANSATTAAGKAETAAAGANTAKTDAEDKIAEMDAFKTEVEAEIEDITGQVEAEKKRATAKENEIDAAYKAADAKITADYKAADTSTLNTAKTYADTQDTAKLAEAKKYTDTKVAELVDSAPGALDTLEELAQALGDDPNFATTVSTNIGKKADKTYVDGELAKKADKTHTHTVSQITDKKALTITLNGASAEGTGKVTYDASAAKTIDITPAGIGAAAASHTHSDLATKTELNATTTSVATQSANGLMSSTDKKKLDNLKEGGYVTAGMKDGTVLGTNATAEGFYTTASGCSSHAVGFYTTASGGYSHAEGSFTTASEYYSHAEGFYTTASGGSSHAEGYNTTASGYYSHAEGYRTTASGYYQHVGGQYNIEKSGATGSGTESAFIIGNGTSSSRSNAFRVQFDGAVYGKGSYNSSGADYAEYFEWADGNPDKEDRRGLFVTLDGDRIRIATDKDGYILGIVSPNPSVVGNSPDEWQGRFLKDEWGSYIKETVTETVKKPVPGKPEEEWETEERQVESYVVNPEFSEEHDEYVPRSERAEWAAVGMLGVLVTRDDGTCRPNGYCKVGADGRATASETGYRVLKRVSGTLVKVLFR